LRVPSIDVVTIGAGGGSIASIAAGGFARVGPESAGSDPGPACYGRGGSQPTVSDANLFLGRLGDELAGGAIRLDPALARGAIEAYAAQLGLPLEQAALGIIELACFKMADAIRQISVARGRDPRRFALVASGGAGPLHAGRLAELLGIPLVIVPRTPGVGCSTGLLASGVEEDVVATEMQSQNQADLGRIAARFEELEREARRRIAAHQSWPGEIDVHRSADVRYRGQRTELTVPVPGGTFDATAFDCLVNAFNRAYREAYGYDYTGQQPIELVNVRVTARLALPAVPDEPQLVARPAGAIEPAGHRLVYFSDAGWLDSPVFERSSLAAGDRITGPAVIAQYDCTTLILPSQPCEVHDSGSLLLWSATADR
jgi:N-methylhydantoinase A